VSSVTGGEDRETAYRALVEADPVFKRLIEG